MRWKIRLDEYDYTIIHKPGSQNRNADSLSRITTNGNPEIPFECNVITRAQSHKLNQINSTVGQNSTGLTKNTNNNENTEMNTSITSLSQNTSQSIKSNPPLDPSSEAFDLRIINSNHVESSPLNKIINMDIPVENIIHFEKNESIKYLNDEAEIEQLILEFHTSPLGGHQGLYRTYNRLKNYYVFPNMYSTIKNFISSCKQCQTNKHSRFTKEPMRITTTSTRSFEKIFLDIVGPMASSHNNNRYILTMQDDLSKYSIATAIPNQEAETIAKSFVKNFICIYGIPSEILSDQGANFMSSIFSAVCKLLKIKKTVYNCLSPAE